MKKEEQHGMFNKSYGCVIYCGKQDTGRHCAQLRQLQKDQRCRRFVETGRSVCSHAHQGPVLSWYLPRLQKKTLCRVLQKLKGRSSELSVRSSEQEKKNQAIFDLNLELRTSNFEPRTLERATARVAPTQMFYLNLELRTSNIEHRTSYSLLFSPNAELTASVALTLISTSFVSC